MSKQRIPSPALRHLLLFSLLIVASPLASTHAIQITLDYTLDTNNENWFDSSPAGQARRAAVDTAAAFLSAIITNDDWSSVNFSGDIGLSDIDASTIVDLSGNVVAGTPESDGRGFSYDIPITNRSTVAANEYVIYVNAFEFDFGTTAHAKAIWDGSNRRNAAGFALTEFNTWGGQITFDTGNNWFTGLNPGIDPTDNYGIQDPNKMPTVDITTDNWDWNTTSNSWKGFQLNTLDITANNRTDLYATAMHEMIHALGVSTGNMPIYVGVDGGGNFIGENVMSVFGGPVPGAGGHFDNNVQSLVWDSDDIISEVQLDPNSTSGVRKYLTQLDAALLRDLGYQVLDQFNPADFNFDGLVNASDLNQWQTAYGVDNSADADKDGDTDGADFLIWQRETQSSAALVANSIAVPEPSGLILLAIAAFFHYRRDATSFWDTVTCELLPEAPASSWGFCRRCKSKYECQ